MTVGCLVLHQRYKRRVENYLSLTKDLSTETVDTKDTIIDVNVRTKYIHTECDDEENTPHRARPTFLSQDSCTSNTSHPDIEDLCKLNSTDKDIRSNDLCNSSYPCSGSSRQHCQELVRDYHQQQQQLEFQEFYNNIQSLRHTVVLILLLCSMFVVSVNIRLFSLIFHLSKLFPYISV